MSPTSLAVRNAVNQVPPPSFAVPPEPSADDVEPFWEAPPGGLGEARRLRAMRRKRLLPSDHLGIMELHLAATWLAAAVSPSD
eukprot:s3206_g8.t1